MRHADTIRTGYEPPAKAPKKTIVTNITNGVIITMMNAFTLLLIIGYCMIQSSTVNAFVSAPNLTSLSPTTSSLGMAGFGAAPSNNKKKELKIKPKAQWDRYTDMKKVPVIRVAVRKTGQDDDWLEVGRVRAQDKVTTEIAVARQRALIADVSNMCASPRVKQETTHDLILDLYALFIARASAVSTFSLHKRQSGVGFLGTR